MKEPATIMNTSTDKAEIQILVVEDNIVNQRLVKVILEPLNYSLDFAINGKEAIGKVANINYSLILMDIQMPILDGFQAAKHIRLNIRGEMPIVGLTANIDENVIEQCMKVGMNDFLGKPFSQEQLVEMVQKWVGTR